MYPAGPPLTSLCPGFLIHIMTIIILPHRVTLRVKRANNNMDFTGDSDGKESASNAGDLGLISGWGRSLGGGHGNPLQYSCPENPMDRGA